MNRTTLIIAAAALALAACAGRPTVPADQPHGLVIAQDYIGARDVYPVFVVNIDGINIRVTNPSSTDTERLQFRLAPGRHSISLVADLRQVRQPFARHERNPMEAVHAIEFEVEEGKVYMLAAKHIGPAREDWEPVILWSRDRD